jgi:hypothetical protein
MPTLRWTLRAKRLRTPSLTGSLLSPPAADGGGVWWWRRCRADTVERSFGMFKRKRMRTGKVRCQVIRRLTCDLWASILVLSAGMCLQPSVTRHRSASLLLPVLPRFRRRRPSFATSPCETFFVRWVWGPRFTRLGRRPPERRVSRRLAPGRGVVDAASGSRASQVRCAALP